MMSNVLAINAGSSSLKFQLIELPSETIHAIGVIERIGMDDAIFNIESHGKKDKQVKTIPNHEEAVKLLLAALTDFGVIQSFDEIDAVGHRVVHGAEKFSDSVLITDEVIRTIDEVSELAPLHNPANLSGILAFKEVLPEIPMVAVFDTAFHQTMPKSSYLYSLPRKYYTEYGIREYGFHGTSHKFVSARAAEMIGAPLESLRLISCHIGNGASVTAIEGGKSLDTSMGFTPLAGVTMGTRSGDIDPALIAKIMSLAGKTGIDRNQQALLCALKPYLTEMRLKKLEKAMKAARLAGAASTFLPKGTIPFLSGR